MIVCLFVWSSTSFCSYSRVPILAAIYICTGADSNNVRSQRVHTIEEHFVVSQQVLELLGSNNPPPLRAFAWSVLFVLNLQPRDCCVSPNHLFSHPTCQRVWLG